MTMFDETKHPRGRDGRFDEKAHTSPEVTLTLSREDRALALIAEEPPKTFSPVEQQAWRDASKLLGGLHQQPASYIAYQAQQSYETLTKRLEGMTPSAATQYWVACAARFDTLAEELHRIAGKNRYPNRAPENVGDDLRDGTEVLDAALSGTAIRLTSPVGLTQTRAALRNRGGEPDGEIRVVALTWDSVPAASGGEPLAVTGPKDGRPIVIDVKSGCPTMEVLSGHAIIIVGGNGFGITVGEGAKATVLSEPGQKVSITAEEGSEVDFYAEPDTRGHQCVTGANFRLHGRADKVSLSTDREWVPA